MISDRQIDQVFSDLKKIAGGIREDYFGLLYLEIEQDVARERALNQIAFGGNDYGVDGFHFDKERKNLYIYQFKYSPSYSQFKGSLQRLIDRGMEQIFVAPNQDAHKNQILIQLRSSLIENRNLIDQICFRFVFTGDPEEAERSRVLDKLREDLENKKYLVERFFGEREVQIVVDFRSSTGKVGAVRIPVHDTVFKLELSELIDVEGPNSERLSVGFLKLTDLLKMHNALGRRFLDRNIRYGLGDGEAVNTAIQRSLKKVIIDQIESPLSFAFNHNGITLYAEKFAKRGDHYELVSPRLLNGAQTVTTLAGFRDRNKDNPKFDSGQHVLGQMKVTCRILTGAEDDFVTRVTINNNRQNPVEPWNLHANDRIQLELCDKFRDDLGIFYERQENAFRQLTVEDLEEGRITEESKAIHILKLTQTFLLSDGQISRMSEMRRVFEEDKLYEEVFKMARLRADSRHIMLCYKVERRLRLLASVIEQARQNKYSFIAKARALHWALLCQAILNHKELPRLAEQFGTSFTLPVAFTDLLTQLSTTRVRPLLSSLIQERDHREKVSVGNFSFLRTDAAFKKCMIFAHDKWKWLHKKLC